MKLIELLEVIDENRDVEVKSVETDEVLTFYDGLNSIDECFNECEVVQVSSSNSTIQIWVVR